MTNLGPRLTQNILQPLKGFQIYIKRVNSEMEQKSLTVNELKEIFLIKLKVMMTLFIILSKNFFRELCNPLLYIFNLSSSSGIFLESFKWNIYGWWEQWFRQLQTNICPSVFFPTFSNVICVTEYINTCKNSLLSSIRFPSKALYWTCYHSIIW